jgi:di/tricarboxylate transporter
MPLRQRTVALAVGLFALALLLLVQFLTWREHGRFNPGAWILIALMIGPLFLARRSGAR